MRVNIYGEELTSKVEVIRKAVDQRLFCAVRFYLESSDKLHHSEGDNDQSGVTFWARWTKDGGNHYQELINLFEEAAARLRVESMRR